MITESARKRRFTNTITISGLLSRPTKPIGEYHHQDPSRLIKIDFSAVAHLSQGSHGVDLLANAESVSGRFAKAYAKTNTMERDHKGHFLTSIVGETLSETA